MNEKPTRKATIADITCDSDGRVDRFVDARDVKKFVELHEFDENEPYYIGAFLVGAYQETLGDLHNLFGDTHVAHVKYDGSGNWWIDEIIGFPFPTSTRAAATLVTKMWRPSEPFARTCLAIASANLRLINAVWTAFPARH